MDQRHQNNGWLEQSIVALVEAAKENRLIDYGDRPIFGRPIVAVTPADNPLFKMFRNAVSENISCRTN